MRVFDRENMFEKGNDFTDNRKPIMEHYVIIMLAGLFYPVRNKMDIFIIAMGFRECICQSGMKTLVKYFLGNFAE